MFENETASSFAKKMLPRIGKAVIKGVFYFALSYALPMSLVSQVSGFAPNLVAGYTQLLTLFVAIIVFFVVAAELTSGTIYQHGFNIGRAMFILIFFVITLNHAVIDMTLRLEGTSIGIWADLRIFLIILIAIDLLALAKSTLQAVDFLSEKGERQLPTPQPTE